MWDSRPGTGTPWKDPTIGRQFGGAFRPILMRVLPKSMWKSRENWPALDGHSGHFGGVRDTELSPGGYLRHQQKKAPWGICEARGCILVSVSGFFFFLFFFFWQKWALKARVA